MEKDELQVKQISQNDINDIAKLFCGESFIQSCFKKRLSLLNIKEATIEGSEVSPQMKEVFEKFWLTPLIHDIAACISMYGFVQFKICKERIVSKYENELKKELNSSNNDKNKKKDGDKKEENDDNKKKDGDKKEEGNEDNNKFNVLVPRVILVPAETCIYIEHGIVKIAALQNQDNVKKREDVIHCIRNNLNIGPVYENGIICTEIGLLLEAYRNLYELKGLHKQVRVDAAFPPTIIQKARVTDFNLQVQIHSDQLEEDNDINNTAFYWNKDGKLDQKSKPPTIEACMSSSEVKKSINDSKKPRYSIENQHFVPPGYLVVNNKSEPKLLFDLKNEIEQVHELTENAFNINRQTHKGNETKLQVKSEHEHNMKSIGEYKRQLENVMRDIWIYTQKESIDVDIKINIPLETILTTVKDSDFE